MEIPNLRGKRDSIKNVTTGTAPTCAMAGCFQFKIYAVILQQSEKTFIDVEVVNVSKCSRLLHNVSQNTGIKSPFEEYDNCYFFEKGDYVYDYGQSSVELYCQCICHVRYDKTAEALTSVVATPSVN
jgi:pyruvate/2-oxoacid:ferredoxin oxidoreductase beta subunit